MTSFDPRAARKAGILLAAAICMTGAGVAWSHGDVTPQAVDTSTLPKLGTDWRAENPFRGNDAAIKVGTSAYNQNCARCHGLEAVSGGIAPDLRKLDDDCVALADAKKKQACMGEISQYYTTTVRKGRTRDGRVYMPPFDGVLSQEAVWAIKTYLESRHE